MARVKVVHSEDSCMIIFKGSKKNPEPSTGVIKFPGGHVEVSRCTDGTYWAHVTADSSANIVGSRVDYGPEGYAGTMGQVRKIPFDHDIQKLAIRVDGPFIQAGD